MLHIDVTECLPDTSHNGHTVHIRNQTLTFDTGPGLVPDATTGRGRQVLIAFWNPHPALTTGDQIAAYHIRTTKKMHHRWDTSRLLWKVEGEPALLAWNAEQTRYYGFTAPDGSKVWLPYLEEIAEIEKMLRIDPTPDRDQVDLVIGLRGIARIAWHPHDRPTQDESTTGK